MDFTSIDILKLLPQKPPFIMVGNLAYFDKIKTVTTFKILPNNIFVENELFSASGVIENIAQTCAVRMGYINQYIYNKNVKLGFIGSVRNLEIYRLPKANETLTTTIEIIEEVFQMTLVKAKVMINEETICDAEMKIALSNIDSKTE